MFARILTVALVALLALPIVEGSQDAGAKKKTRTRTVTETFTNTGTITIPEEGNASPFPSEIEVDGLKRGKVSRVRVSLDNLSHTNPDDVNVLLLAPDGRFALLLDDAGGDGNVTNIDLTFDDDATTVIPNEGPMVGGTFRASVFEFPGDSDAPYDPLSTFEGSGANGAWQLFVFDDLDDESGQIANGWSLEITAKVKVKRKKK
jgi:subtilisin-like proprotein convertase family protein